MKQNMGAYEAHIAIRRLALGRRLGQGLRPGRRQLPVQKMSQRRLVSFAGQRARTLLAGVLTGLLRGLNQTPRAAADTSRSS